MCGDNNTPSKTVRTEEHHLLDSEAQHGNPRHTCWRSDAERRAMTPMEPSVSTGDVMMRSPKTDSE